jgi:isochorismate hydrolase
MQAVLQQRDVIEHLIATRDDETLVRDRFTDIKKSSFVQSVRD